MVHRAGPRRSAGGLLCRARFPGQGIARTRLGWRALRLHRAMAQGTGCACLRPDARIAVRTGDRRRSGRARRASDLRHDVLDAVSLIAAASVFAHAAAATEETISRIGAPSTSLRSTPSIAQNVGAKSMIDTVRSSTPCTMPGPAATNMPPGKWSPVLQNVYSPASSPIADEPRRIFEIGA